MSDPAPRPRQLLDLGVLVSAVATAAACLGPWARVRSVALFRETGEVAAYLTPPGFMAMLAALLAALIAGLGRNSDRPPEIATALSTALLVPSIAGGGVLLAQSLSGPGDYRGAPMVWTSWFYTGLVAALAMAALAIARTATSRQATTAS